MSLNGALCHSWDRFLNTSNHVLVAVWRGVADFVVECPASLKRVFGTEGWGFESLRAYSTYDTSIPAWHGIPETRRMKKASASAS